MTEKWFHCSFSRTVCEDLHIRRTAVGRAIFFMALRAWGSQGLSWGDVSSIKMWEDQSNPKGWSDKQLPKPVFSCPAVEQTQHRLISWRSFSCEAHTASSPVKMSPCTSRGAGGRSKQTGCPDSPMSCDQIFTHKEAAKSTSQVLQSLHGAKASSVSTEVKASNKNVERMLSGRLSK